MYQKFQEFPKEAFRPDEIPSNSHYCFAGHYIVIIVTRIVPDVQSTVDTTHFIIRHGQDPDCRSYLTPSETEMDDMKVNMILAVEMS